MTAKTKAQIFVWFVLAFLVCVMISICNDMRQAAVPVKLEQQRMACPDYPPVDGAGRPGVCK